MQYYPSCWETFGTHGEMRDEIHADPSRGATSFESSVISGSFERFWENISGWMGTELHLLVTPKLPCEYTRYSPCLGFRVITTKPTSYQKKIYKKCIKPTCLNSGSIFRASHLQKTWVFGAKFDGLKRNLRGLVRIREVIVKNPYTQRVDCRFFIWPPRKTRILKLKSLQNLNKNMCFLSVAYRFCRFTHE